MTYSSFAFMSLLMLPSLRTSKQKLKQQYGFPQGQQNAYAYQKTKIMFISFTCLLLFHI